MNKWRALAWGFAAALVALPAVAMSMGAKGVLWTASDFILAIVFIGGTGLLIELALRLSADRAYRAGFALALITSLLLFWVNGAVGFFASEDNPFNLAFGGVIGVFAVGALLCWSSARRMANVLVATAAAQVFVAVIAYSGGYTSPGSEGLREATVLTGFFTVLWLASSALFRAASKRLRGVAA